MVVLIVESVLNDVDVHFEWNWRIVSIFQWLLKMISKIMGENIFITVVLKLFAESSAKFNIWKFRWRKNVPLITFKFKFPWWNEYFKILFILKMHSWSSSSSRLEINVFFFSLNAFEVWVRVHLILKIWDLCHFDHLALIQAFHKEFFLIESVLRKPV